MTIIEVRNLSKRYGDHTAVDSVSFAVAEDDIFGIVGPNAAGKTTIVECIAGCGRRTQAQSAYWVSIPSVRRPN